MNTAVKLQNLLPGQEVALANCAKTGRVIARVGKNLYRIAYAGQELEISRFTLGVNVHGRWTFGPANTTEGTAPNPLQTAINSLNPGKVKNEFQRSVDILNKLENTK